MACKRNDQAFCLIILGNFEDLNLVMVNGLNFDYSFFHKIRTRNRIRSPRLKTYGVIE